MHEKGGVAQSASSCEQVLQMPGDLSRGGAEKDPLHHDLKVAGWAPNNNTHRLVHQAGPGYKSHHSGETVAVEAVLLPQACNGREHNSNAYC